MNWVLIPRERTNGGRDPGIPTASLGGSDFYFLQSRKVFAPKRPRQYSRSGPGVLSVHQRRAGGTVMSAAGWALGRGDNLALATNIVF